MTSLSISGRQHNNSTRGLARGRSEWPASEKPRKSKRSRWLDLGLRSGGPALLT